MNVERINQIAQDIRNNAAMFDMQRVGDPKCGTPGCIAGFTLARYYMADGMGMPAYTIISEAGNVLGLDRIQLLPLFLPNNSKVDYAAKAGRVGHITAEHAARCLEHLAKTSKVDWDATAPKQENENETRKGPEG